MFLSHIDVFLSLLPLSLILCKENNIKKNGIILYVLFSFDFFYSMSGFEIQCQVVVQSCNLFV